eukprot:gnl/TRDRNA2_/TRDRNA2_150973_c0_seq1.p1 gnl/TRDRNA2_/TRDRNA2_150973_c0~~gnl/TRDRNA2_/TRDRNA2_150973_c0_seq1.p1  ORF type:complete len:145 (+),score=25.57 gnl/TRDRNA2_/TRDRNA2_150973_c0_seq1:104-538(+)
MIFGMKNSETGVVEFFPANFQAATGMGDFWTATGVKEFEGTFTLAVEDGILQSTTEGALTLSAAEAEAMAAAATMSVISPILIVVTIIFALYVVKNLGIAHWKSRLAKKKLLKWKNLQVDSKGRALACVVYTKTWMPKRSCPRT